MYRNYMQIMVTEVVIELDIREALIHFYNMKENIWKKTKWYNWND